MSPFVRYYPVRNGDCTLIGLSTGQHILIDCAFLNDGAPFDAHGDVLGRLARRDGRPYLPAFILTHGDEDHCRGFAGAFHVGSPAAYQGPAGGERPRIVIGTLWFSPHLLVDQECCDDAKAYQLEAHRRLDMHRRGDPARHDDGNRIRVVGYSSDPELHGVPDDVKVRAGDTVSTIDGVALTDFRLFIHAPFRNTLDDQEVVRNNTSIAFLASFDAGGTVHAATFFFAGDANHAVLEEIVKQSRLHVNEGWLHHDLWMAPHHCSWTAFNEVPYEDHPEPNGQVLDLLDFRRPGARVVASCKPVRREDTNPPHFAAKEEYVSKYGSAQFHCTMDPPPGMGTPLPIHFDVTPTGPALARSTAESAAAAGLARRQRSSPEYGAAF